MTLPLGFIRDLEGELVPFGRTKEVLTFSALEGALPFWLQTPTTGTGSFVGPDIADGGYYQVATAATASSSAELQTKSSFRTSNFEAMLLEVEGYRLSGSGIASHLSVSLSGSGGVGGYAHQQATADQVTLVSGGQALASGDKIKANVRSQGEGILKRNFGLMIIPASGEVLWLEGGKVQGHRRYQTFTHGLIKPGLWMQTTEAVARSFRFDQLRLTTWRN